MVFQHFSGNFQSRLCRTPTLPIFHIPTCSFLSSSVSIKMCKTIGFLCGLIVVIVVPSSQPSHRFAHRGIGVRAENERGFSTTTKSSIPMLRPPASGVLLPIALSAPRPPVSVLARILRTSFRPNVTQHVQGA